MYFGPAYYCFGMYHDTILKVTLFLEYPRSNFSTMVLPSETSLYHGTTTTPIRTIQYFPNDALFHRGYSKLLVNFAEWTFQCWVLILKYFLSHNINQTFVTQLYKCFITLCKVLKAYGNSNNVAIKRTECKQWQQTNIRSSSYVFSGSRSKSKAIRIPPHGLCWRATAGIACADKNVT